MQSKFTIYNFSGKPVSHFLVDQEDVSKQAPVAVAAPSHHIVIHAKTFDNVVHLT